MEPLREFADTIGLRFPSLVFAGDTVIVAGNHFPADIGLLTGHRRLVVGRVPGGMMPIPAGAFDFAFPRLAVGANGSLHLVWAEFADSTGSAAAWTSPPTSLWHSMFVGGRWSTPRKIFSGRTVSWSGEGRLMTRDSRGNIHVVVPALLAAGRFAVVYLRIDTSGTVAEQDFSPGAGYVTITNLAQDSLLVAYSTSDSLTPKGGSSILVRVSPDGGQSWGAPVVIVRSERRNSSPPFVERTETGLHAVWVEMPRTSADHPVLRAFSTRSAAAAWTEITPPHAFDEMPVHLVSTGTACGTYAIAELLGGSPADATMHLVAVTVRDGRFIASRLFQDLETAMSIGVATGRGEIRVIFSAIRKGEQRAIPATASGRACRTM
jgi:hypothetical protein